MMRFDCDITASEIQQLAGADAVAAFFARLGYRTDVRVPQTPGNLGITADGTVRPIKRVELIADQEGLLQVYLFELTTVTVTHTRALARAFRNRAGNYLLVLTSDYDRLDFVLVEKYLPTAGPATAIGQAQVGVRPRMLTVERRKPGRVELRVLRRFTYTESDPLAQYDKMLSAYAIADWSEEFFNNRALFSDYYLLERLRDRPEWAEDPKPAYAALQELYRGASSRLTNQPEDRLRADLLEPVFKALGFAAKTGKKSASAAEEPDYRLFGPDAKDKPLALCLAYPWGRSLDGKDDQRDKETPEENPGAVVVSALEKGETQWAVVTNGKVWRLYSARAHSRATNYYEIDLEEALSPAGPQGGSPAESFRYFWLLFRRHALEPAAVSREGREQSLCFLDLLLAESEDYAKELGERLKERVFKQVFPHLAEGFLASIRKRDGKEADLSDAALAEVFRGTLTFLYRLLFLLYAESRDLLPAKEVRGYFEASITKLKREVAEAAGTIADEVEGKLRKTYRDDSYALYDRLARLFTVVDQGDPALNVPVYNGGLFLTQPQRDDDSPEAHAARFLNTTKVSDRDLACALNHLVRDEDPKRHDLVFIDFKSLGVRQLGSIYEGLLEFKVRIAPHKLAVTKEKGREVYVPFADLDEREQARSERTSNIVKKSAAYLENDKHERKATGSYYTPDPIVKYIVEHAVGPVLEEKFEKVRPLLRKAQADRAAFFKQQEAFRKQGMRPKPDAQADLVGREVVDELFDIKVLDPAMGSGHFLVEAVDFITDRTLTFLAAFPWNPVLAHLGRMRETILAEMDEQGIAIDPKRLTDVNLLKRQVLKRCIYGVDLNPMAVELAKVSLWLDCFTLGAPLSFLDHHLRCGNSLIGVTVEEVREALSGKGQMGLFGQDRFARVMMATDLMRHVGELSDVTSAQVQESRREYHRASEALARFKRILDIYTSRWFGNTPVKGRRGRIRNVALGSEDRDVTVELLGASEIEPLLSASPAEMRSAIGHLGPDDQRIARTALAAAEAKRFFHWELEFPEVFYGPSAASTQVVERKQDAGFDAVIGNPPYVKVVALASDDVDYWKQTWQSAHMRMDISTLFYELGIGLIREKSRVALITSIQFLSGEYGRGLRSILLKNNVEEILDLRKLRVFEDATTYAGIIIVQKAPGSRFLLRQAGEAGTTMQGLHWYNESTVEYSTLTEGSWPLETSEGNALIGKLGDCACYPRLSEVGSAHAGLVTGADDIYIHTAAELEANGIEMACCRPLVRSFDPQRWFCPNPQYFVIYPYTVTAGRTVRLAESRFADLFPGAYRYLRHHKDHLLARGDSRTTMGDKGNWFGLVRFGDAALFGSPKIVTPGESIRNTFAYDPIGWTYPHARICAVTATKVSLRFLMALLNSATVQFYLHALCPAKRGGYRSYSATFLNEVPVPRIVFSTPEKERQWAVRDLKERHMHRIADGGDLSELIGASANSAGLGPVAGDVLHDFLDSLAEEMFELSKTRYGKVQEFFAWLAGKLEIVPDQEGMAGIESLAGKTKILGLAEQQGPSPGDAGFEALWEVVQKNSARMGRPLDATLEHEVRAAHLKITRCASDMAKQLASINLLVDNAVCSLYALNQHEKSLVFRCAYGVQS